MKSIKETLIQILFGLVAFVVIIFTSLGISFDFSLLREIAYWIEVLIKLAVTMIFFNIIYYIYRKNIMHDTKSRFYKAFATNKLRIKKIENDRLYDKLEQAIKEENQERLETKCNNLLHLICTRVTYAEVMEMEDGKFLPAEDLAKKYRVFKHKMLFVKVVERIRSGRVRVKPITEKQFLQDKELLRDPIDKYDYSIGWEETKRNLEKIIIFLITQIIGTAIVFSFFMPNFWAELVTNLFVVLGAIFSGFLSAQQNIKLKTAIYEHRNAFLHKKLNLEEEYILETTEKK
jgi:hypothetical protein